jgi:hypothetical protein
MAFKYIRRGFAFLFLAFASQCFSQKASKWEKLYNGKDLAGWDTYIGPDLDSNGKKINETPIGLNKDPRKVFTVVKDGNEKVIRVSGQLWGGISTAREFENFHLQLKFKWGTLKWGQKKDKKRDSGLLYHCVGPHGMDASAWMRSQEFQIEEGNTGDYWGVAGGVQDVPVVKIGEDYVYDPKGELTTFSEGGPAGRHCVKNPDGEKPSGKWNTLDLYCFGDTSVHIVNGKVVMVLYHSSQMDNGEKKPLTKGKIQLQSEGAEVFYKDIRIQPVNKNAEKILNL